MTELFFQVFKEQTLLKNFVSTGILLFVLLVFRAVARNAVYKFSPLHVEDRGTWLRGIRNITIIIFFLGLLIIWASELRTFAVSLVAVAAAIVIALKELLLCMVGGVYKLSSRPFRVGDRISIKGLRGDVADHNFLSTILLEIGPELKGHQFTGRRVWVPNSVFLSEPLINESLASESSLHTLTVPVGKEEDWRACEAKLLEFAREETNPYFEKVKRELSKMESHQGLEAPSLEPRVTLSIFDSDRTDLFLRFVSPVARKGTIEQGILKRYVDWRQKQREL